MMLKKEELIIIGTSAPEDRLPYRRDLLNCLCYPDRILVRFSYRKCWIEKQLLELSQSLKGRSSLIVFCDIPQHKNEHYSFIPIRHAQFEGFEPEEILDVADDDTYIAVNFTLNHFVSLGPPNVRDILESWQRWVMNQTNNFPRPRGHPEEHKSNLVFKSSNFKEEQRVSENTSWQIIMEQLSKARTLKDCSFFRTTGIYKLTSNLNKPILIEEYKGNKAYVLKSDNSYKLEFLFYLNPDKAKPPKSLIPRVSTQSIALSQPLIKNIGLVTNATIILNCSRVYTTDIATMVIKDPEDEKILTPRAEFLLILKPKRWMLWLVLFMLAIGAFFTGVSADMIKEIVSVGSFIEKYAELFSYIIKGIGAFLVGMAGYLGFKKIPSI